MNPPFDKFLVSASQRHDSALGVMGLDGKELVKAIAYDEETHRTARVRVEALPLRVSDEPGTLQGTDYACSAIRSSVAVGDFLYVDWSALNEANRPMPDTAPHLYVVGFDQVVAQPDGCGGFLGFAGYVLCEPIFPDTVVENDVEGTVTESGIILVSDIKPTGPQVGDESNIAEQVPTQNGIKAVRGEGLVRYTGIPLRHQRDEVKAFDHVVFDKRVLGRSGYPLRVKLEGRELYAVRRDSIVAVRGRFAPSYATDARTLLPETEDPQASYKQAA